MIDDDFIHYFKQFVKGSTYHSFTGESRQSHTERLAQSIADIKEYWLAECFKRCLLVEDALDFRQAYTQEQQDGHRTLSTFKCDNQYVSQLAIAHTRGKLYALFWWNRDYVLRPDTKALVVYQPS